MLLISTEFLSGDCRYGTTLSYCYGFKYLVTLFVVLYIDLIVLKKYSLQCFPVKWGIILRKIIFCDWRSVQFYTPVSFGGGAENQSSVGEVGNPS